MNRTIKDYLREIAGNLFIISVICYLIFVLMDSLSRNSISAVLNLNIFLILSVVWGVLFLVFSLRERKKIKLPLKANLLLLLPYFVLAFYFLFRLGNPLNLPRTYVYDFCHHHKVISELEPKDRVAYKRNDECYAGLQNSLVYFDLEAQKPVKNLELEIEYKSQANKMYLGVKENGESRELEPLFPNKDFSSWQRVEFRFDPRKWDLDNPCKITLVFMNQELPTSEERLEQGEYPLIFIKTIKAKFYYR